MSDVNLLSMLDLKKKFNTYVGYSDHTLGIEVPIAAVALGALVVEKHFTINRKMKGPDHSSSLQPQELKQMVLSIRNIDLTNTTVPILEDFENYNKSCINFGFIF